VAAASLQAGGLHSPLPASRGSCWSFTNRSAYFTLGENGHHLSHTGEEQLRVEHLGPDPDLGVILWRSEPH